MALDDHGFCELEPLVVIVLEHGGDALDLQILQVVESVGQDGCILKSIDRSFKFSLIEGKKRG